MATTQPGFIVFGSDDPSYVATQSDLASTEASKGASLIGIQDSDSNFTATTVESALQEVKEDIDESIMLSLILS